MTLKQLARSTGRSKGQIKGVRNQITIRFLTPLCFPGPAFEVGTRPAYIPESFGRFLLCRDMYIHVIIPVPDSAAITTAIPIISVLIA